MLVDRVGYTSYLVSGYLMKTFACFPIRTFLFSVKASTTTVDFLCLLRNRESEREGHGENKASKSSRLAHLFALKVRRITQGSIKQRIKWIRRTRNALLFRNAVMDQ